MPGAAAGHARIGYGGEAGARAWEQAQEEKKKAKKRKKKAKKEKKQGRKKAKVRELVSQGWTYEQAVNAVEDVDKTDSDSDSDSS